MPDHLILSLETLSARRSRAVRHWAIVRAILGVNVGVGASELISQASNPEVSVSDLLEEILSLEGGCVTPWVLASEDTVQHRWTWLCDQWW